MDNRRIRFILLLSQKKYCPPSPRLLFLSRSYFVFNIRYVHMIPASTKIFPRDPLGAILNFRRRDVERLEVSQRIFNLFSALPPSFPSAPEIVSILTRFTIAPRLKSCLMHSIDSQSKLDEQSARSNNDVIGYFARDARMEQNFPWKTGKCEEWVVVID